MRAVNGEIIFKNRAEGLKSYKDCRAEGLVLYDCDKCGVCFAASNPYTTEHGIICSLCQRYLNLSDDDNYTPSMDDMGITAEQLDFEWELMYGGY